MTNDLTTTNDLPTTDLISEAESWTLSSHHHLTISYHAAELRWSILYSTTTHGRLRSLIASAYSPLELTTILHAIGTGRLTPARDETVEEYIKRGGVITHCKPRYAAGGDHRQGAKEGASAAEVRSAKPKLDLSAITIDQLLGGLHGTK